MLKSQLKLDASLEKHINENFSQIQHCLNDMLRFQDRTKNNFLDIERKLVDFEHKLEGRAHGPVTEHIPSSKLEEKIRSLEDTMMLLELEVVKNKTQVPQSQKTLLTPNVPSRFEDRLKTLEEKFHILEKLKLNVPVELVQHEPRLKSIESNVQSLRQNIHEEVIRLENMMNSRAVTEQSAEHFVKTIREEMNELRHDLGKAELLKKQIITQEHSLATRPELDSFEKKVNDEISHIREDMQKIHNVTDRTAVAERSIDAKLADIENKLHTEFDMHRRTSDTKIANTEEKVMKFAAEIATKEARKSVETSISSHKEEIEAMIKVIENEIARIRPIMTTEKVSELIKRVATIERDLESRATAIVSKEISSFSEAVDRRFPELVTKPEFVEWSREIHKSMKEIEAPDTTPVITRMDRLELRLHELLELVREMSLRIPIIVE